MRQSISFNSGRWFVSVALIALLAACRQPFVIVGEGDIVELTTGLRGCTLEEFQASDPRCTDNEVVDEAYNVIYQAVPRPGWRFREWQGPCPSTDITGTQCQFSIRKDVVDDFNAARPGFTFTALTAVFERDPTVSTNGIDYTLLDNPEFHDDGVNVDAFDSGIFFDPDVPDFGLLGGAHATRDGVYIPFFDVEDGNTLGEVLFNWPAVPGSGIKTYVAKIPYEPVGGCRDWCFTRRFEGLISGMSANEIDDGDFEATVLYQRNTDGLFVLHYLSNGFEVDVPSNRSPTGRWIPYDPANPAGERISIPLEAAITHRGVTQSVTLNNASVLLEKTVRVDGQGAIWEQVDYRDLTGDESYGINSMTAGQEAVLLSSYSAELGVFYGGTSFKRIVLDEDCDSCGVTQVHALDGEAFVVLEGENDDGQLFDRVYRVSFAGDGDSELLYVTTYPSVELEEDLRIAVSDKYVYLSNGKAITRKNGLLHQWLPNANANDPIQSQISLNLRFGFGLLGADDRTVILYLELDDGPRIARMTPFHPFE